MKSISHLARPLSLTIRLYANMYAGEQVTMVFLGLTYFLIPAVFMGLHVFVSLLQAYIFMLLTMMYVAGGHRARALIPALCRSFSVSPAAQRMTGTTSWERFLRRKYNDEEVVVPAGADAAGSYYGVRADAGYTAARPTGGCRSALAFPWPSLAVFAAWRRPRPWLAAAEGMARNPGAAAAIRFALLLGLVLIESLALYTLVIIILKVG